MPRFLHTADWQIGRQYARFAEEDASILADARFVAVERLAELADRGQVDAVLVAGDIFDAQTVSDRTLHRSFQAMVGYAGSWILIPGNHDAALAESVWTRAERLRAVPENVHVLTKPGIAEFAAQGFVVLPAPLIQRQTHEDLTAWFDTAESPDGLLRIGLAHGSVEGQLPESADSPNPIAANRAATARLDYLALGDWHGTKQIDARTWYSGTPEQERFKDNGAGQVLIVDIDGPGATPQVQPHSVGRYRWVAMQHTLTVPGDLNRLLQALDELPNESVVDLTLDGHMDLAADGRMEQALKAQEGRHRSFRTHRDQLQLQPTEADIAVLQADGYVGEVVEELRQRQATDGDGTYARTARDALVILAGLLRDRQTGEAAQ